MEKHGQQDQDGPPIPDPGDQQHRESRPNQVELLFHRQGPGVQQRLLNRAGVEVASLAPEIDVRRGEDRRNRAPAECLQLDRRRPDEANRQRRQGCEQQPRKQPPDASMVEVLVREVPGAFEGEDISGNQKAADDEEHINANEPATEGARKPAVKQEYGDDCYCPQSLDVSAKGDTTHYRSLRVSTRYNSSAPYAPGAEPRRVVTYVGLFWTRHSNHCPASMATGRSA